MATQYDLHVYSMIDYVCSHAAKLYSIQHPAYAGLIAQLTEPWTMVYWAEEDGSLDELSPGAYLSESDDSATIPATFDFSADTAGGFKKWQFAYANVSQCIRVSDLSDVTWVTFDGAGYVTSPVGNGPTGLSIDVLSGGRFRLAWSYLPDNEDATPTGFHIYRSQAGALTLLGSVNYVPGRVRYNWTSDAYADGTEVTFLVRAYKTVNSYYPQESGQVLLLHFEGQDTATSTCCTSRGRTRQRAPWIAVLLTIQLLLMARRN